MHLAGQALIGEHDFSSFRSSECQANHAIREVQAISVSRDGDAVHIDIRANGFLHNMVRIVTGCLLSVGRGEKAVTWIEELLSARDRTLAGATVAPFGLYFIQPQYPTEFGIPDFTDTTAPPWHP
jgi:tRNA pseudouridine38-40 synthase